MYSNEDKTAWKSAAKNCSKVTTVNVEWILQTCKHINGLLNKGKKVLVYLCDENLLKFFTPYINIFW